MATSPNYGWAEPDNSSLVKNGAQDIRALGDAIDTSLWNVGFGQAGKNKIINGDFGVNQRAFTTTTTNGTYGFDRWFSQQSDGTCTYSAQTFTPGAAPVAGYEGKNFAQMVTTGQTATSAYATISQRIESVRTFAGQTVTISFWAKANTGTPKIAIVLNQNFGTGGSGSVITAVAQPTISTSWARYSATIAVPSISGKTVGSAGDNLQLDFWFSGGSDFNSRTGSLGIQSNTFGIWGVQVEAGSKATPFQTATGTIQGELAACQRYYQRFGGSIAYEVLGVGSAYNTNDVISLVNFPVSMRVAPTTLDYSTIAVYDGVTITGSPTSVSLYNTGTSRTGITFTKAASVVLYRPYSLIANNSTSAYIGFSAEL